MLTKEWKDKWIAALRSGKYKQGQYHLSFQGRYCCLGVLCQEMGIEKQDLESGVTKYKVPFHAGQWTDSNVPNYIDGLKREFCSKLSILNDKGWNFEEIADYIEIHVPAE